jgi:hypothetical protein
MNERRWAIAAHVNAVCRLLGNRIGHPEIRKKSVHLPKVGRAKAYEGQIQDFCHAHFRRLHAVGLRTAMTSASPRLLTA